MSVRVGWDGGCKHHGWCLRRGMLYVGGVVSKGGVVCVFVGGSDGQVVGTLLLKKREKGLLGTGFKILFPKILT